MEGYLHPGLIMATVTVNIIPDPEPEIWTNPSNVGGDTSGIPLSKIVFREEQVSIAVKDAADATRIVVTAVLPPNFVYRLYSFNVWVEEDGGASAVDDFQIAMMGTVITNAGTVIKFPCFNNLLSMGENFVASSSTVPTVQEAPTGAFSRITWFTCDPSVRDIVFDNSQGGAALGLDWWDITTDATPLCSFSLRFEFLQYTIDALNSWRLNTPLLTTGF